MEQEDGLFSKRDPAEVDAERRYLQELSQQGLGKRLRGYLRLSGPGFLQSAFSLGGGSLSASLMAGALMGYALLWVQPVAMLCGVVMMLAMAYQAVHSHERPLQAVRQHVHPILAWGWAVAALLASLIWVLPQYNLSVDVLADISGLTFSGSVSLIPGGIILLLCIAITWGYGADRSSRGVRLFEFITRALIVIIILSFGLVVLVSGLRLGAIEMLQGMFGFHVPSAGASYPAWQEAAESLVAGNPELEASALLAGVGSRGFDLMVAAFSAAVGINMVFLYPYSIKARGWGPEHSGLARFDCCFGVLLPFVMTTSLLMIAAANQFYGQLDYASLLTGQKPNASMLAESLSPVCGHFLAHWIFGLGVLAMTVSSIAMMMLVSGFVICELTGKPLGSPTHRVGLLLPSIGVLAPLFWREWSFYIAVPTSILCLVFLPIAYFCVMVLQNKAAFLGDAMPRSWRRWAWNLALGASFLVVVTAVVRVVSLKLPIILRWCGLSS